MCGRFSLSRNREQIRHDVEVEEWLDEGQFVPRYNIAPRTQAPVIRRRGRGPGPSDAGNNDQADGLVLHTMKWGLVPHWSKTEDKTLSTTNARSENLIEGGGMWASVKGKKRCAVPCQGYYEWLTKGKEKLPHFIKRKDGNLLLMAGLYDCATIEGKPLWTFSIVTTDANKDFSWLHDRQPVFLTSKEALDRWLDTSSQTWTTELTKMVQPYSDASTPLDCYQVPKEVGRVGTESPTFVEPIANRKDGIQAMFSKQREKSVPSSPAKSSLSVHSKRKMEESESPPPTKSPSSTRSPVKKVKKMARDDSNQPDSSATEAIARDAKSKSRGSRKAPSASKRIESFFRKAQ